MRLFRFDIWECGKRTGAWEIADEGLGKLELPVRIWPPSVADSVCLVIEPSFLGKLTNKDGAGLQVGSS